MATPARVSHPDYAPIKSLVQFFAIAYAWTWAIWFIGPRLVHGRGLDVAHGDNYDLLILIVGTFGPTIAAIAAHRLAHRNLKAFRLWTGWRSTLIGLAVGMAVFFPTTVILFSVVLAKGSPFAYHWAALAHWKTYAINCWTFLGGPLGEEPGWRGFALPRLQERFGPFMASLILALLWAGWHLPLFFMPNWTSATPWQFCFILAGVSLLLTLAANLARFGVIVAILLHVFFNVSSNGVNAVTANLPTRSNALTVCSLAIFAMGVLVAICSFRKIRVLVPR